MRIFFILLLSALTIASFGMVADFTADKMAGCPPLVVNLTDNSSIDPTSWAWDFGNGNISTLQNPSATFLNSGTYQVRLVVSNGSQTDTVNKTITVYQLPVVNFTANKTNACFGDTIIFASNVTTYDAPITQYAWGYGNGLATSNPNATYSYPQTGTYNITLVVQDSVGCTANKTIPAYITVSPLPHAAFTASPSTSCNASQLVAFTNESTGTGLTYSWDLDSGVTTGNVNPTHLYQQEVYNVKLSVIDANGCQSVASEKVNVVELSADFSVSNTHPCTGQKVQFTNTSNFEGTAWFWDFGDGTTSTSNNPAKTYSQTGTYTVKFKIMQSTCADSLTKPSYITVKSGFSVAASTFGADTTITCGQPLTVNFNNTTPGGNQYSWNFGNGDTSNLQNPNVTFNTPGNYTVTLTVTDSASGCSVTGSIKNFIQTAPPAARFNSDTVSCVGGPVQFHNQSIDAQRFLWIFGDGDSSTATNPVHTYFTSGSYNVTLIAYSNGGCDTSITKYNCLRVDTVHAGFVVNATFSPCPPFVCLLSNRSDKSVVKFFWDFGDGCTDTAANPTHIYFYPGVFTVKLIGTTVRGCVDTTIQKNLITVQGPTGLFTITPKTGCVPLDVNFSATPSSNTQSIWCDLGDGDVITDSLNFIHGYNTARVYYPRFILTDHVGCTVSYPLDSIITHNPPVMHISDTSVCGGVPVKVSLGSDAMLFQWSPPSYLDCSTCGTVTISAPDTITYQIIAVNQFGCEATGTMHVDAAPLPVLSDSLSLNLCKNDVATLFVGNANKIVWSPALYLSDSTSANPVCNPLASVNYTVTAFNALGCTSTTQVPVIVKDKVDISLPNAASVCADGSLQLQTKLIFGSDLGVNYTWSPAGYLNNAGIANPVATMENSAVTFQVIASSGHCVPDTETIVVTVNPNPNLEVSSSVATTTDAGVPLYADSHQELTYQWYSKDSFSCSTCRRTILYPTQTQVVYVDGTNQYGCTVKDSVFIEVQNCDANSIFMPNTFTPNGDGVNDKFFIRTTTLSSLKYFRIFDRAGELVFETRDLNEGWDGSVKGKAAENGVYVYELQGQCQNGYDVFKTGNIAAIR